jgi:hypothetical protein
LQQLVSALYRLQWRVEIEPEGGPKNAFLGRSLGLGHLSCADCTDQNKKDRGFCPFVPGAEPGLLESLIDSTGDEARDVIRACPLGLRVRNPALALAVAKHGDLKAAGGPGAYTGIPLGQQPARVSRFWAALEGAAERFQAEIDRARAEVDAAARKAG